MTIQIAAGRSFGQITCALAVREFPPGSPGTDGDDYHPPATTSETSRTMPHPDKRAALGSLTVKRLGGLCDTFELERPRGARKNDLIEMLARSKRISLQALLAELKRESRSAALLASLGTVSRLDNATSLVLGDALVVLARLPSESVHAVVTDPPYSNLEYAPENQRKLREGRGGVWRIPPAFDGSTRKPLPRFTVLTDDDYVAMEEFFGRLADELYRVLVPGGHVLLASNPLLCEMAFVPFRRHGFEKRGVITRLVRTLRGGDRPKGAHLEYPELSVMPRSAHEPWGLFRKPMNGTVAENLAEFAAGALRRPQPDVPFSDVIVCGPARGVERQLSDHPSLKPQRFLRQVVRALVPLGRGVVLDPFAGSGSTLAAASHVGLASIGIERDPAYHASAIKTFSKMRDLSLKEAT